MLNFIILYFTLTTIEVQLKIQKISGRTSPMPLNCPVKCLRSRSSIKLQSEINNAAAKLVSTKRKKKKKKWKKRKGEGEREREREVKEEKKLVKITAPPPLLIFVSVSRAFRILPFLIIILPSSQSLIFGARLSRKAPTEWMPGHGEIIFYTQQKRPPARPPPPPPPPTHRSATFALTTLSRDCYQGDVT